MSEPKFQSSGGQGRVCSSFGVLEHRHLTQLFWVSLPFIFPVHLFTSTKGLRKQDIEYEKEGEGNKEKKLKDVIIVFILKNKKLAACLGCKSVMIRCPRRGVLQNI